MLPQDLNTAVGSVLDFISMKLDADKVTSEWVPTDKLPLVKMDLDKMKQVFLNLIINASQAMPEGGHLKVGTMSSDLPTSLMVSLEQNGAISAGKDLSGRKAVGVYFKDGGTGISPNVIGHIFDPFFTTKSIGNGLGLSVCAKIIENHGGMILAENLKEGGAVFTVWFPVD